MVCSERKTEEVKEPLFQGSSRDTVVSPTCFPKQTQAARGTCTLRFKFVLSHIVIWTGCCIPEIDSENAFQAHSLPATCSLSNAIVMLVEIA